MVQNEDRKGYTFNINISGYYYLLMLFMVLQWCNNLSDVKIVCLLLVSEAILKESSDH